MSPYNVEFYQDANGEWRWRLQSGNGRIVATSAGDGYKNMEDAVNGFLASAELIAADAIRLGREYAAIALQKRLSNGGVSTPPAEDKQLTQEC